MCSLTEVDNDTPLKSLLQDIFYGCGSPKQQCWFAKGTLSKYYGIHQRATCIQDVIDHNNRLVFILQSDRATLGKRILLSTCNSTKIMIYVLDSFLSVLHRPNHCSYSHQIEAFAVKVGFVYWLARWNRYWFSSKINRCCLTC